MIGEIKRCNQKKWVWYNKAYIIDTTTVVDKHILLFIFLLISQLVNMSTWWTADSRCLQNLSIIKIRQVKYQQF